MVAGRAVGLATYKIVNGRHECCYVHKLTYVACMCVSVPPLGNEVTESNSPMLSTGAETENEVVL